MSYFNSQQSTIFSFFLLFFFNKMSLGLHCTHTQCIHRMNISRMYHRRHCCYAIIESIQNNWASFLFIEVKLLIAMSSIIQCSFFFFSFFLLCSIFLSQILTRYERKKSSLQFFCSFFFCLQFDRSES